MSLFNTIKVQMPIKLYVKKLNEQKNGFFLLNFDESYLFVCTHIQQQRFKEDNYFMTLNLLDVNEEYNLLFVEGDFDKCTISILKKYILSKSQFEE